MMEDGEIWNIICVEQDVRGGFGKKNPRDFMYFRRI